MAVVFRRHAFKSRSLFSLSICKDEMRFSVPRTVSTWSPLASIFNRQPVNKVKWPLKTKNVGLFGIPELTDYTKFYLLQENVRQRSEELIEECVDPNRSRKLVQVFDELSDTLCKVADMADFVRMSHPQKEYCQAAEDACVQISGLVERLNTNEGIHDALDQIIMSGTDPAGEMDAIDERVAELFMFDFKQSGVHLPPQQKKQFVALNQSVLMLGTYFQQGCHKPRTLSKHKLPASIKHVFSGNGDTVTVGNFHSDNAVDSIREAAYRIYLSPENHQMELLDNLLANRHLLASLVGFPTYAHRALGGTLGGTPENVKSFLEILSEKLKPRAEQDFAEMKKMKNKLGGKEKIMPWDVPYYSSLVRHQRCHIDGTELSHYFSLGSCMDGLSNLFQALYGVSLEAQEHEPGEVWAADIYKLAVVHESDGLLGHIYCDLFERPGKAHQDCHFTIRGGRQLEDGSYQNPIVVLMLNFPPPRGAVPSLLTPNMMENLFHEFGHAMHSMLGRTRYQHVTGTRCPTDFAETPSVLMEYFASDPRVLKMFARHWQTGEPIPEEKLNSLWLSKRMFSASEMEQQVFYSILDQTYHGSHPLGSSTTDILANTQNMYYSLPYVPNTAWQLRFGHFVGYGAKYYSYLMSRAVASRLWLQHFQKDPFSRSAGERYQQKVLAHGGGIHPSDLVQDMLNEETSPRILASSLIEELDSFASSPL